MYKEIGINWYGCRKAINEDFENTILKLKQCGAAIIEPIVAFLPTGKYRNEAIKKFKEAHSLSDEMVNVILKALRFPDDAAQKIEYIKSQGLNTISVHAMIPWETEALPQSLRMVIDFAKKVDLKKIVVGFTPDDIKKLDNTLPLLKTAFYTLRENGLQLIYHNHEHEMGKHESGAMVLEYILKQIPELKLELDVGWVAFAKVSPYDFFDKYKDKIALIHYKDITSDASPETRSNCFTAIGEGILDLNKLSSKLVNCKNLDGLIIDQDNSNNDIFRDYAVGITNIKNHFYNLNY